MRASILLNVIVLAAAIYTIHHHGWTDTFKDARHLITAPFTNHHFMPSEHRRALAPSSSRYRSATEFPATRYPWFLPRIFTGTKPKLTLVIDDIGYTMNDRELLRSLGHNVTYAILPLLPYSRFFGLLSGETKAEVILHQPLESEKGTIPGPGLITDRMPREQIIDVLTHGLESVPHLRGVNNHMGSRGTANPKLMALILGKLKQRGLFFLDSMTTPKSVGWTIAREMAVPAIKRDIFLDNRDTPDAIRGQLQKLTAIARERGYAVGIGHYRYNTLTVLNEEINALKKAGFEIVSLQELIEAVHS